MKTLKHLAIVALVCYGASSFAGAAETKQISEVQALISAANMLKKQGKRAEAKAVAQDAVNRTNNLMDQADSLTETQLDQVIDLNSAATQLSADISL